MLKLKYLLIIGVLATSYNLKAQTIGGMVKDPDGPVAGATLQLYAPHLLQETITNGAGKFTLQYQADITGKFRLRITHVGYIPMDTMITLFPNTPVVIDMTPVSGTLQEVFLTARETRGLTTSSVIDKEAMRHLQPSSLTDIMELLPGGRSIDPALASPNLLRLRETGIAADDYSIGTLGTAFMVDGVPMNTTANLQYAAGIHQSSADRLNRINTVGKGVDMRSISTDNIEKVEVMRGVPSAEYGNLTNGMVKIFRKKSATPWEARIKADGFSSMGYAGKGFEMASRKLVINAGFDYLHARADPRTPLSNYKRYTATFRINKTWITNRYQVEWDNFADYTGSFDIGKTDMDDPNRDVNRFQSRYNKTSFSSALYLQQKKPAFFRQASIHTAVAVQRDKIIQDKWVQAESAQILATHTAPGAHNVGYLTPNYMSHLEVDGRPLTAYLKAVADFAATTGQLKHNIKTGAEWNYSKNNGDGQRFNPLYPPAAGMTLRNRRYKDIPAATDLSFFLENSTTLDLYPFQVQLNGGVRFSKLLNLPPHYTLSRKVNADPRVNLQTNFPSFRWGKHQMTTALTLSYGIQTMYPVLDHLFPEYVYLDLVQFNYYHNDPAYRTANVYTYRVLPQHPELNVARNTKWEARLDIALNKTRLSVTAFTEKLPNGFRDINRYEAFISKRYNSDHIDPDDIVAPPDIHTLPYDTVHNLLSYTITENGSLISRQGIEYQLSTRRIAWLNSRFTINGAWLYSFYENSRPLYQPPPGSIVVDGVRQQYIGLYLQDDGYKRQRFNTNLTVDNYLPGLGLTFSTSFQAMWWTISQNMPRHPVPLRYIDPAGQEHEYTSESQQDAVLQWLIKRNEPQLHRKNKVPFEMNINFKASRAFRKIVHISLFVNRILRYSPDYYSNGALIRRSGYNTPYFGMELNFKL